MLKRRNHRQDLFETTGAVQAFSDCLWDACDQATWRVNSYRLMKHHYHLASETPNR